MASAVQHNTSSSTRELANQSSTIINTTGTGQSIIKTSEYSYKGELKNSVAHGRGVLVTKQYVFDGQFRQGVKVKGTLFWNNGTCTYEGEFLDDQFHGKGILIFPSLYYQGDFENGKKHGKGVCRWKIGRKYEGEYANGLKEGQGTLYNSDSTVAYRGEWKKDFPHGWGEGLIDGMMESGYWKYGKMVNNPAESTDPSKESLASQNRTGSAMQ